MADLTPPQTMALIERARADDADAMRQLFERFLPRVRNIAAVRLGKSTQELVDVDDVTQEALTDAFLGLERFDTQSDGKLCNWLAMLVENRIRMTLRAGRAEKRGGGNVKRFTDEAVDVRASHIPGESPTPSRSAAEAERNEEVQRALCDLTEEFREVLLQRVYCRMSFNEIADAMELRNGDTVRGIYTKALRALQARLGPDAAAATQGW